MGLKQSFFAAENPRSGEGTGLGCDLGFESRKPTAAQKDRGDHSARLRTVPKLRIERTGASFPAAGRLLIRQTSERISGMFR
jgi:hypothetical protein